MTTAVDLVMPFPPVPPNPSHAAAATPVWAWVDASGIAADPATRKLLRRADPGLTTARYFPTAGPEVFTYLAQLMAWIFVNDDQFDDGILGRDPERLGPALEARLAVLAGAPGDDVFERALADLWARRPRDRSPAWETTFRADLAAFLRTYSVEAGERWSGRLPSLEEYRAHRRDTAGTRWCADLVEVAVGVDLPDEVRAAPAYPALKDAAAEHCGLVNDLFSAAKEAASGQVHNAVLLVERDGHDAPDRAAAERRVNDMATACVHAFEAAAAALPDIPEARAWVAGVRALVRGNVDWHLESQRYRTDRRAGNHRADEEPT